VRQFNGTPTAFDGGATEAPPLRKSQMAIQIERRKDNEDDDYQHQRFGKRQLP
jgi:hypothetical protein